jgi:molybdopterin-binding protein
MCTWRREYGSHLELPGGAEMVSIITKASAERLHLQTGMEVYAVVKASDVMIATD